MDITQATATPIEISAGDEKFLIGHQNIDDTGELVAWVRKTMIDTDLLDVYGKNRNDIAARHKLAWNTASQVDQGDPVYRGMLQTHQGQAKLLQVLCNRATPQSPIDFETATNRLNAMDKVQLMDFYRAYRDMMTSPNPTTPEQAPEPTNG